MNSTLCVSGIFRISPAQTTHASGIQTFTVARYGLLYKKILLQVHPREELIFEQAKERSTQVVNKMQLCKQGSLHDNDQNFQVSMIRRVYCVFHIFAPSFWIYHLKWLPLMACATLGKAIVPHTVFKNRSEGLRISFFLGWIFTGLTQTAFSLLNNRLEISTSVTHLHHSDTATIVVEQS